MAGRRKFPHTYVIDFYIILFAAFLTWVVPGGSFQRETVVVNGTQREVIAGDSYTPGESAPQSWQVFSALFDGFVERADIIVFILMIGGAFWIMNHTRAIDAGIYAFLRKARAIGHRRFLRGAGIDYLIVVSIMLIFSIFGATFGMSEETIAFVIIFVPLAIGMGYDSIVGVSLCFVAAALGFAGALLNPFTIGIAQGLSGLPLFSGIEYRLVCWVVINMVGIGYILWYMRRIKHHPLRSPVYDDDGHWRQLHAENTSHALPQYATQGSCPSTMPAELGRLIASDTTVGVDRTRTCCEFTESTSTAPLTRTNQGAISGTLVARWTMSNETPGARSMTCMRSCRRSRTAKSV